MCVYMMSKVFEYAFKEATANGDRHIDWCFQINEGP